MKIHAVAAAMLCLPIAFAGCGNSEIAYSYGKPEVLVAPSNFSGVHGLAVDQNGRLLAGSVIGNAIYEVHRDTGVASAFIPPSQGEADDIAVGPNGELAWTSFLQGIVHYRAADNAPVQALATGLPGINSLAFDMKSGRLYASQVFLGDALWEIDPAGVKVPRLILKDMGGFNGFEVSSDGWIYGPLWFKGQVVRINPDSGELVAIAAGFTKPAAANFDSKGNLYVVDSATGQLVRVDLSNGGKTVVAQLKSALDNLAIDKQDRIYVSNMADNSIEEFDLTTGNPRIITKGSLAVPGGLKVSEDGKTLYVSDGFAFRSIETATGKVTDIKRMQESDLEYPMSIGISNKRLLLTSWFSGALHVIDRATMKTETLVHGFTAPTDAVELHDGSVLVSEIATGNLVRVSGTGFTEKTTVVQGLAGPVQMIVARGGIIYVTEAAGSVTRIDPKDWSKKQVANGLMLPEGLAETPEGRLIVAETLVGQLSEIDPDNGERRVVASNLPIGLPAGKSGVPPAYIPTGVTVDAKGKIYVTADRNNALYRIPRQYSKAFGIF